MRGGIGRIVLSQEQDQDSLGIPMPDARQLPKGLHAEVLGTAAGQHVLGTVSSGPLPDSQFLKC